MSHWDLVFELIRCHIALVFVDAAQLDRVLFIHLHDLVLASVFWIVEHLTILLEDHDFGDK